MDDRIIRMGRVSKTSDTSTTKKKRRKRRKRKRKVNNGPKRTSGFIIFSSKMRPILKSQNPQFSFGDLSREVGLLWNTANKDLYNVSLSFLFFFFFFSFIC